MSSPEELIAFARESYDRFNELCFGGALPRVPIVLTNARTFLGKTEYKVRRNFLGRVVGCSDMRLKLSTAYELSREEMEDVIIHEMIHCSIACRNIHDTSAHGEVFRLMMARINEEFGRHVCVRHKGGTLSHTAGRGARTRCVCISTFIDGRKGVTVCSPAMAPRLKRLLPKYFAITSMEWYESSDPFFDRYPSSRTPKIYRISPENVREHL